MKGKTNKNNINKPIFKKWWFWAIIVVLLVAIFGNNSVKKGFKDGAKSAFQSEDQQTTSEQQITSEEREPNNSSDSFIEDVKSAILASINSDEESITSVTLNNGDLCISVDLSKADPAPLTMEDLAISRTSSITDAILALPNSDDQWNTITVDFGEIGKITNSKDNIKENEAGGRYFSTESFSLE